MRQIPKCTSMQFQHHYCQLTTNLPPNLILLTGKTEWSSILFSHFYRFHPKRKKMLSLVPVPKLHWNRIQRHRKKFHKSQPLHPCFQLKKKVFVRRNKNKVKRNLTSDPSLFNTTANVPVVWSLIAPVCDAIFEFYFLFLGSISFFVFLESTFLTNNWSRIPKPICWALRSRNILFRTKKKKKNSTWQTNKHRPIHKHNITQTYRKCIIRNHHNPVHRNETNLFSKQTWTNKHIEGNKISINIKWSLLSCKLF